MTESERNDDPEGPRRRKRSHRSRSSKREHRSRSREYRREESRRSNRPSSSTTQNSDSDSRKDKLKHTPSDLKLEDVEALDFDPNISEGHKNLKGDPKIVEENMQENIFSLIYVAPVCSGAFWFALVVALFQLALPFLALLDLIVLNDDEGNFLQLPKNVSVQVRIMAAMVLILAVVQFWDLMEALEKLQKGPPPSTSDTPEGAKKWKFYMSYTIQMIMGALFEIAVFVFIMQSTTILDVFLNFAALEFITSVDEFAFALGKRGYISNAVKKSCDEVSEIKILRRKGGRVCRRIQMFFFIFAMLAAFGVLSNWQINGKFDCEKIEVQFGDGFITILPVFSGEFTYTKVNQRDDDKRQNRPVYWDKQRGAAFRYCPKGDNGIFTFAQSGYWVFNIILDDVKNIDDMCDNFISRSPETKGFDVLEFPGSAWETKRRLDDNVLYNVDYFQLRCGDCEEETCNGKCEDNKCICKDNQFGYNCQFRDAPCPKTDYDRRTNPFRGVGDKFSSKFSLVTTADPKNKNSSVPFYSYNRPVYSYAHSDGVIDFVINFGRRFFIFDLVARNIDGAFLGTQVDDNGDEQILINTTAVVENLTTFHPWYDWIKPFYAEGGRANATGDRELYRNPVFVSDPIDVGTQSDSLSPLGLSWRRVKKLVLSKKNYFDLFSLGALTDTVLLCSRCSESSPCLNGGVCQPNNNTCQCPTPEDFDDDFYFENLQSSVLYSGTLCELDCTEPGINNAQECTPNFDFWADDDDFPTDDGFGDDDDDDDDNFPTDDGNAPADDGNFPADDGNFPTDDGNAPTDDGNLPTDDGNVAVTAENIFDRLLTVTEGWN